MNSRYLKKIKTYESLYISTSLFLFCAKLQEYFFSFTKKSFKKIYEIKVDFLF